MMTENLEAKMGTLYYSAMANTTQSGRLWSKSK